MRLVLALLIGWVMGAAPPAAAVSPSPASSPHAVTDEIGRTVMVPARPARIVSLAPAITETLFAIGAGPRVVGVTRFCDYPPEAKTRTVVGGFADPDVERIVALAPDLVIATADTTTRERFDAMAAAGLTLYAINPRDLAGVAASIRHVGGVTGDGAAAEAVASAFEAKVAAITKKVEGGKARPALFLFSIDPLIAAGPDTFVDQMLVKAGARNVASAAPTSYPRFGAEGILAADPEIVFVTVPGAKKELARMIAGGSAAKKDGIVEVDANLLERPGPRLADGLEVLARALHPEAFAK